VVVEDHCAIGGDCEIHPNTVIHYGTRIGSRVVIWSGAVIGSYGFGFAPDGDRFVTIPQLGHVVLEDDVRVGAGTAIDRGAAGPTRVKQGTKIDNLVHIAHNVQIGENCAVTAQVGISGSTVIGDRVKIGGQAGFVGHIEIGDDSFVGAQAGVSRSFPAKSTLSGYPARDLMDVRRSDVIVGRLPEIAKRLDALEKKLKTEGK
jgi:UDP-3-O-[3-hydroxymyristoyl] glucosamine N-acyltransferase